jgi:hypothetical protein
MDVGGSARARGLLASSVLRGGGARARGSLAGSGLRGSLATGEDGEEVRGTEVTESVSATSVVPARGNSFPKGLAEGCFRHRAGLAPKAVQAIK